MNIQLDKKLILAIHDRQLAEHGGRSGLRDSNLLESALARPQQRQAYGDTNTDLPDLAAAMAYGLVQNLPFIDGNKRTAYICYQVFLALNNAELNARTEDKYVSILALAEGKLEETDFAAWLRKNITIDIPGGVHEPKAKYAGK